MTALDEGALDITVEGAAVAVGDAVVAGVVGTTGVVDIEGGGLDGTAGLLEAAGLELTAGAVGVTDAVDSGSSCP